MPKEYVQNTNNLCFSVQDLKYKPKNKAKIEQKNPNIALTYYVVSPLLPFMLNKALSLFSSI